MVVFSDIEVVMTEKEYERAIRRITETKGSAIALASLFDDMSDTERRQAFVAAVVNWNRLSRDVLSGSTADHSH